MLISERLTSMLDSLVLLCRLINILFKSVHSYQPEMPTILHVIPFWLGCRSHKTVQHI